MALATLVLIELVACSTLLFFGWLINWLQREVVRGPRRSEVLTAVFHLGAATRK